MADADSGEDALAAAYFSVGSRAIGVWHVDTRVPSRQLGSDSRLAAAARDGAQRRIGRSKTCVGNAQLSDVDARPVPQILLNTAAL